MCLNIRAANLKTDGCGVDACGATAAAAAALRRVRWIKFWEGRRVAVWRRGARTSRLADPTTSGAPSQLIIYDTLYSESRDYNNSNSRGSGRPLLNQSLRFHLGQQTERMRENEGLRLFQSWMGSSRTCRCGSHQRPSLTATKTSSSLSVWSNIACLGHCPAARNSSALEYD